MTLSHMRPHVSSRTRANASSIDAAVCVAPKRGARVRFSSTGSMAKILSAPASRAPWRALAPMPPPR